MKKLYLAVVHMTRYDYMESSKEKKATTLVWADDEDDARQIIDREYNREESYSWSVTVNSVELTEALGSPV
ncbi:MAG: hypothetical protein DI537_42410 [Stutzerimonas stutzeri]|nr:MAG: hypothetical protein DI537_42410 [Stutzerimonas stutzeri]